jgi:hypothetical protein
MLFSGCYGKKTHNWQFFRSFMSAYGTVMDCILQPIAYRLLSKREGKDKPLALAIQN